MPRTSESLVCSRNCSLLPSRISCHATARLPPYITSPSHHTLDRRTGTVDCWSHVKIEYRFSSWLRRARVIVDHIADFSWATWALSLHKPVVAVKRRLAASRIGQFPIHHPYRYKITHPYFSGYTYPKACNTAAFGVISFGLPINLTSLGWFTASSLAFAVSASAFSSPILHISQPLRSPPENLLSHPTISAHAPSFKKLCTATILSTASCGVSV